MQPCMGLSLANPRRDSIHRDLLSWNQNWCGGGTKGTGQWDCCERYRTFKAGIHFMKILASPAGDSWNPIYIGEFTGQAAWSVSESNWSLVSSHHKHFLRYQVQVKRTRPINVPQLTLPSPNQISCKILGLLNHFLKQESRTLTFKNDVPSGVTHIQGWDGPSGSWLNNCTDPSVENL